MVRCGSEVPLKPVARKDAGGDSINRVAHLLCEAKSENISDEKAVPN